MSTDPAPPPAQTPLDQARRTAAAWHHPHYLRGSQNPEDGTYTFEFRKFTGYEGEPRLPHHVYRALSTGQPTKDDGVALARINAEVNAARIHWYLAGYRRRMLEALRRAVALWQPWQNLRAEALGAYQDMFVTPDGQWRAALLHLVVVRTEALAAADAFDDAACTVAGLRDDMILTLAGNPAPTLSDLLTEAGLTCDDDLTTVLDTHNYYSTTAHSYTEAPEHEAFTALTRRQDLALKQVAVLAVPAPHMPH